MGREMVRSSDLGVFVSFAVKRITWSAAIVILVKRS